MTSEALLPVDLTIRPKTPGGLNSDPKYTFSKNKSIRFPPSIHSLSLQLEYYEM